MSRSIFASLALLVIAVPANAADRQNSDVECPLTAIAPEWGRSPITRTVLLTDGAPALADLQITVSGIKSVSAGDAEQDSTADLAVLLARDADGLKELEAIRPAAKVVITVSQDGDWTLIVNYVRELKGTLTGSNLAELLEIVERAESQGSSRRITGKSIEDLRSSLKTKPKSKAHGEVDSADGEASSELRPRSPIQENTLRQIMSNVYATLPHLDAKWSVTFDADGNATSITISGTGLTSLYKIIDCFPH